MGSSVREPSAPSTGGVSDTEGASTSGANETAGTRSSICAEGAVGGVATVGCGEGVFGVAVACAGDGSAEGDAATSVGALSGSALLGFFFFVDCVLGNQVK